MKIGVDAGNNNVASNASPRPTRMTTAANSVPELGQTRARAANSTSEHGTRQHLQQVEVEEDRGRQREHDPLHDRDLDHVGQQLAG